MKAPAHFAACTDETTPFDPELPHIGISGRFHVKSILNARTSAMRIWFMACEVDGTPFHKDFIEASTVPRMGELVEVPITGHEGVDSISDWRVIDVHWRIYEDTTRGTREYEAEIYLVSEAAAARAEGLAQITPV